MSRLSRASSSACLWRILVIITSSFMERRRRKTFLLWYFQIPQFPYYPGGCTYHRDLRIPELLSEFLFLNNGNQIRFIQKHNASFFPLINRGISSSLSSNATEESTTYRIRSASEAIFSARSTPIFSTTSSVERIPAVSMIFRPIP